MLRLGECGLGLCQFRAGADGGHAVYGIADGGGCRLAAELEIVQRSPQFEQCRGLASCEFEGAIDLGLACGRVVVGLGA